MKMTELLFATLRTATHSPAAGLALLRRAGYLHERGAWLPLGLRVRRRLEESLHATFTTLGGQEFSRQLPGTAAERLGVAAELFGSLLRSHRQLPRAAYQLRARSNQDALQFDEFLFEQDLRALASTVEQQQEAVRRVITSCGLDLLSAQAGLGRTDFLLADPGGQQQLLSCPVCDMLASREAARFRKPAGQQAEAAALQEVATPGATTIESLATFLGISPAETAKAVFLRAENETGLAGSKLIFVVLRGDMMLSETKLAQVLGTESFRPATEAEISAASATAGYGSPLGVNRSSMLLVVDDAIPVSSNLVGGANRAGHHLLNTNYGRDYEADLVADVALAEAGAACFECGTPLELLPATRLGGTHQLSPAETTALNLRFLDADNQEQAVAVATLELDVDELLLAAAMAHHDEQGLVWPAVLAPFAVLLAVVGPPDSPSAELGRELHAALRAAGVAVLLDDRAVRPGVKFNDADLLGIPLRVTLGARGLAAGKLEAKWRGTGEQISVPVTDALNNVVELLRQE